MCVKWNKVNVKMRRRLIIMQYGIEHIQIRVAHLKHFHVLVKHCLDAVAVRCSRCSGVTITKLHDRFIERFFTPTANNVRVVVLNLSAAFFLPHEDAAFQRTNLSKLEIQSPRSHGFYACERHISVDSSPILPRSPRSPALERPVRHIAVDSKFRVCRKDRPWCG